VEDEFHIHMKHTYRSSSASLSVTDSTSAMFGYVQPTRLRNSKVNTSCLVRVEVDAKVEWRVVFQGPVLCCAAIARVVAWSGQIRAFTGVLMLEIEIETGEG